MSRTAFLSSTVATFRHVGNGEMSSVLRRRERRRKSKPKLSFGSSSGACSGLPSNMQANLPELFELLKARHFLAEGEPFRTDTNGWLPHEGSRKEDWEEGPTPAKCLSNGTKESEAAIIASSSPPKDEGFALPNGLQSGTTGPKLAILTEADILDIVRRLREFLKDSGPTPEAELWAELGAEASDRVRSQFGSLRTLLLSQDGFRQVDEDLDSYLYFDEEEENDTPPHGPEPLLSPVKVQTEVGCLAGVGSTVPSAGASSLRAASPGSTGGASSSASYESAEDEEPQRGKDAQTQTTLGRTSTHCRGSQTALPTTAHSHAQTEGFDPAWVEVMEHRLKKRNQAITELQDRLALLEEEHRAELGELHKRIEELQCRSQRQAEPQQRPLHEQRCVSPTEEEIHCLPIEPPGEPLVEARAVQQPVERSLVPDFFELQLRLDRQGGCSSDVESMWSSGGESSAKSKMEQKWDKIIKMVKQKRQSFTEDQIKEYLQQFRESQGGLSRMKFNAIVAGVLALMKNCTPSECQSAVRL